MDDDRAPISVLGVFNVPLVFVGIHLGALAVGLFNGGLLGALTGLVTAFFVLAGIRTVETGLPSAAAWAHRAIRLGGGLSIVLTVLGATAGGWRWGWGGAILGNLASLLLNRRLFLALQPKEH